MANSFLDQLMGGGYAPSLGDLWGGPRAGASNSLNDLFGSPGGLAPSLSSLLGGVTPGPLAPSLGDLFGGVNPGAPSMAAGFAEIKAQQAAKEKALTAPQANANQPGTVNPQNPTSAPAAPGAPSAAMGSFFQQHLPYAQQALSAAGWNPDLAPIMLGIAANEGAAAQGTLANAPYNNAFGIKATPDWQGGTVQMPTTEYVNGQPVQQQATFRTYATPQESYADHIRFLQENPRYAQAIQQQASPNDFLAAVAQAGYATDPNWAANVRSLAQQAATATAPTGPATPLSSGPVGGNPWRIAFDFNQPYTTPLPSGIGVHRGVDLVIPGAPNNGRGTPYTAFVPGVVTNITQDSAGGQGIIVQSADGLYQRYFHNDRVLVKVGDEVGPGRPPIGVVGASGTEGFPHLHFEVSRRVNGDPVGQLIDPRPYLQGALR